MGQGVGEEWREGGGGVLLMEFVVEDIIVENMNLACCITVSNILLTNYTVIKRDKYNMIS